MIICYTQIDTGAKQLIEMIKETYPNADITLCPDGALCSYYLEPGGIMVGFEDQTFTV
jgi:hypothetical protein